MTEKARREKHSALEVASASEIAAISEVAGLLVELAARSFTEPLTVLMQPIIDRIDATITDEYERFQFYENLAVLMEAVKKHFGDARRLKLADLMEFVDDYGAAEMPLLVKSPYRDADDAVQILTAHKAKGLEFEYVFVLSVDDTAWGKGSGNNNLLSLPKNLAQIRHTGMTDGERLRILYVAFTRAKKAIYMTNAKMDFGGRTPKRLEYLKEYSEKDANGDEIVCSPLIPSGKVNCLYDLPEVEVRKNNLKNWIRPFVAASPDMRSLYLERVSNWRMSASSLTAFIDIAYAGPQEFFKTQILRVPRPPETEALVFGNLVHEVFEVVTNRGVGDEEAIALFLEQLGRYDLPLAEMNKLKEKGPRDLAVSLAAFGEILHGGKAEVDFAAEKLVIDGVPVTGKIDHMLVDEEQKTIEIYDFKTGSYHKEKWGSLATLYKYMLQLGFYKLLLNASPRYQKYKVERAHILFVTPDKDGEVYDKIYEFTEEGEMELRKLMRAVYKLVSGLSFMDDPEIFVEADKKRGIREMKDFIELVLARGGEI